MGYKVYVKNKHADKMLNVKEAIKELRDRIGSVKLAHHLKEHEFFESKTVKRKRRKREWKRKKWEGMIEEKILNGDKLNIQPGVYKRIMKRLTSNKGREDKHGKKENSGKFFD